MNRVALLGLDRTPLVDRLTENVEDAAQGLRPHGDTDRLAQVFGRHPAHEPFGGLHGDGADAAFSEVLLHFADDIDRIGDVETLARDTDSVEKFREAPFAELQVDGGAGDFDDFTCCRHFCFLVGQSNSQAGELAAGG